MLFPLNKTLCQHKLQGFEEKFQKDVDNLAYVWQQIFHDRHAHALMDQDVQEKVLRLLRNWQATRNQKGFINKNFLNELAADRPVAEAFFELVEITNKKRTLRSILSHSDEISKVYNFIKGHVQLNQIPGRIVLVSKALLIIAGFSPGFDSRVLKAIYKDNPHILACPGVWPYCLYKEILDYLADQQAEWEKRNEYSMKNLLPNVPIGQIIDRILWTK